MITAAIDQIYNFRRIDDRLTTSGQPSEGQLAALHDDGVEIIINLGLHSHERALPDEAASCAALGLEYIYLPVKFDAPTEDDFGKFCNCLDKHVGQRVHVHCIANFRISAFLFRRAVQSGGDVNAARAMMDSIWKPEGIWAEFIGDDFAIEQDPAFADRDY